mgnify:CR=1 FL=1
MRIGARGKFIDFWSRAVTGPICFESDFDKRVYWPKLKKITEKWGIKYDPDHMVPCDDEMLDRLWQAAIDLVAEVGVLCTDTRRIIEFSRKEILDAAANTADRYTVGVGKDSFTAVHRGFEDYDHVKNPVSVLGRILGPVSQDIYHQIAMSYAQVPQIDMCHFQGNLTEIYGMPITPDSPWEMFSELWSVAQVKDVCRQVCRPGLADGGFPSMGQMFIAREAGPELVGTIGSRSAVVNNDQIVESVSAGVYRAVKAAMGQNGGGVIQLILDGTKVAEVVSDNVNAITRRTGRCPILV